MAEFPDDLISAYLDGELSADEQRRVEQSLLERPELRKLVRDLRRLRGALQSMPVVEPSAEWTARLLARVAASGADVTADATTDAVSQASLSTSATGSNGSDSERVSPSESIARRDPKNASPRLAVGPVDLASNPVGGRSRDADRGRVTERGRSELESQAIEPGARWRRRIAYALLPLAAAALIAFLSSPYAPHQSRLISRGPAVGGVNATDNAADAAPQSSPASGSFGSGESIAGGASNPADADSASLSRHLQLAPSLAESDSGADANDAAGEGATDGRRGRGLAGANSFEMRSAGSSSLNSEPAARPQGPSGGGAGRGSPPAPSRARGSPAAMGAAMPAPSEAGDGNLGDSNSREWTELRLAREARGREARLLLEQLNAERSSGVSTQELSALLDRSDRDGVNLVVRVVRRQRNSLEKSQKQTQSDELVDSLRGLGVELRELSSETMKEEQVANAKDGDAELQFFYKQLIEDASGQQAVYRREDLAADRSVREREKAGATVTAADAKGTGEKGVADKGVDDKESGETVAVECVLLEAPLQVIDQALTNLNLTHDVRRYELPSPAATEGGQALSFKLADESVGEDKAKRVNQADRSEHVGNSPATGGQEIPRQRAQRPMGTGSASDAPAEPGKEMGDQSRAARPRVGLGGGNSQPERNSSRKSVAPGSTSEKKASAQARSEPGTASPDVTSPDVRAILATDQPDAKRGGEAWRLKNRAEGLRDLAQDRYDAESEGKKGFEAQPAAKTPDASQPSAARRMSQPAKAYSDASRDDSRPRRYRVLFVIEAAQP